MCIESGSAGKKKAKINMEVSFVNKLCCFYSDIINNGYLYYFISSPNYETEFINNITGLIGGVSVSILKNLQILFPQKEEQYIIANYLDDKCSKIDTIIKKQQSIIEKLKEYKMSLITETITNAKGKLYHIKYVSSMKNGLNFRNTLDGNKIKFLTVGNFKDYFIF